MLDFDEALALVKREAEAARLRSRERVSLSAAAGRVLAEQVVSPIELPSHDYSAMDGYAVRAQDASEGSRLPVVGECQTGHESVAVDPRTCVRIFTGAHIPQGADAVVMQENVERTGDTALFKSSSKEGANIRRAGEDLHRGQAVLEPGTRLSGFHLGLLASVERTEVLVAPRPRVAIVCTGDELRPAGALFESGHLAESNSVALAALARQAGGEPLIAPLTCDQTGATEEALEAAFTCADVVLTVGGVSVGDHDVVVPALKALGAEIVFHKARIKPGKPILFAKKSDKLLLGLPGNPSSAQVNFALFGFPLLRLLQGDSRPLAAKRVARLSHDFSQKPGRRGFYRGLLAGHEVQIISNQASGATTSMAWANALVVLPETTEQVSAGEEVTVMAYAEL